MARLRPYLDHGVLEIDNNAAERAMRSVALGRKNYRFVGSQTGGKSAAIACTLRAGSVCLNTARGVSRWIGRPFQAAAGIGVARLMHA